MTGGTEDQCPRTRLDAFNLGAPDIDVASRVPGVKTADLTDRFCGPNACYSIRNGMMVYRDRTHHITAAFSRGLAPDLEAILQEAAK